MRLLRACTFVLLLTGCHEDAKCPADMVVDERLGYCVTPDAGLDAAGGLDAASPDGCALIQSYRDSDGDGHGDRASAISACGVPGGYVLSSDDCDDECATCWPDGTEGTRQGRPAAGGIPGRRGSSLTTD